MFTKYNSVLRSFSKVPSMVQIYEKLCMGNTYTTTLQAINSAIVKVSKVMPVGKCYRGVAGAVLPKRFLLPEDKFQARGGVEFGFMSTTLDRDVSVEPSFPKHPLRLSYHRLVLSPSLCFLWLSLLQVAMDYAGSASGASMIMELQMGMVDRGASLQWLSQYPVREAGCFEHTSAPSHMH